MKAAKSKSGTRKSDARLSVKKGVAGAEKISKAGKKAAKDPNMPKRPASAFFVFMEDFRKQFKEEHPNNKSVAAVGKAAGDKWKKMNDEDKAPYVAKAEQRKADYTQNMEAYNKKMADGSDEEEDEAEKEDEEEADSDKSKSEVHDDDDGGDESGEDDDEDDD